MPDVDYGSLGALSAVNPPGGLEGPVIASAATITLSRRVHQITGTTEMATINPPHTGFVGNCLLLCGGAFTLNTGGNIKKAFTAVANEGVWIYYDGASWWPCIAD